ncbi:MAG: GNAT family N-acetyltransferase [Tissierellia bacterium]|nr:GNAT family N-acetyltransferase [Tissierellia bacterium]
MKYEILSKDYITEQLLYNFMLIVNDKFPISLSSKSDLSSTANKLYTLGDIFFIKDNKQIIGLVAGYNNNMDNKAGYISILALLEEYRGKGLATKLVETFLESSEKKEMEKVVLFTHSTNKAAINLYKKLGFYVVELRSNGDYLLEKVL